MSSVRPNVGVVQLPTRPETRYRISVINICESNDGDRKTERRRRQAQGFRLTHACENAETEEIPREKEHDDV